MLENNSRSHYSNLHNVEKLDVKAELNKLPISKYKIYVIIK